MMSLNDDEDDELNLFKQAVADARPIKSSGVVQHAVKKPQPIPRQIHQEENKPSAESRRDIQLQSYQKETNEELLHLFNAMPISDKKDEELSLFKQAVAGARPLKTDRITQRPIKKPKPIPQQFQQDEHQALADSLSDHYIPSYELETGEELLYIRDGHSPIILSKLRRGHWVIQKHIDLHGLVSDEARAYVSSFISDCKKRGIRCIRIVHGKGLGSRNKEPVLKNKLRGWLMQKDEVIAYAQAKPEDGGSGAVIVLLKA